MSEFVKSRNALQCRSHLQKLTLKYRYVNRIINHYKNHNDMALYHKFLTLLRQQSTEVA